jgi:hypothetical protein
LWRDRLLCAVIHKRFSRLSNSAGFIAFSTKWLFVHRDFIRFGENLCQVFSNTEMMPVGRKWHGCENIGRRDFRRGSSSSAEVCSAAPHLGAPGR